VLRREGRLFLEHFFCSSLPRFSTSFRAKAFRSHDHFVLITSVAMAFIGFRMLGPVMIIYHGRALWLIPVPGDLVQGGEMGKGVSAFQLMGRHTAFEHSSRETI
jgi:hypothetical protein